MSDTQKIRRYFQDYVKWFPEEWRWELANDKKSRELYMKHRARKSSMYRDNDKGPYFDSIEKDANQFDLSHVEFTDFFGIKWCGDKGVHRYVGDADYDGHMYYWDPDSEEGDEDDTPLVSDTVTSSEVPEGYAEVDHRGVKEYIDIADAVDVAYKYIVENHLFKDSYVVISYRDPIPEKKEIWTDVWNESEGLIPVWDIHGVAKALKQFKPELYEKFLKTVDEHFKALQNSEREDEREFAPTDKDGKYLGAREYFDTYFERQN